MRAYRAMMSARFRVLLQYREAALAGIATQLFFGVVIILAVIFMPKGLVDLGWGFRRIGWRYFLETIRQYRL